MRACLQFSLQYQYPNQISPTAVLFLMLLLLQLLL
jgi:hypothetical protein